MSVTAIVVEDGTDVASANSYISVADIIQYGKDRQHSFTVAPNILIMMAMDYIESRMYKGIKKSKDQSLQWPRINVNIDGYYFASDSIPQELIDAQCEVAIAIDQGNDPLADIDRETVREKVGPIEVEYASGAAPFVVNRRIQNKLWKLLATGSGGNILPVSKG